MELLDHKSSREASSGGFGSGGPLSGGRWRWRFVLPVLLVCAVAAVVVVADYWSNSGRIYNGVSVAGADVGGKTPAEARTIVEDRLAERLEETPVVGGPRDVAVTGSEIKAEYDAAAVADEAYGVGREGNVFERVSDRMRALYGGAEVSPEVRYDGEAVAREVEEISALVDEEPGEATLSIEGTEAVVGPSREGYRVDVPATIAEVERAVEGATGEAELVGEAVEPAVTTAEAERAAERAEEAMGGEVVLSAEGQQWVLSPEEIGASLTFASERGDLEVGLDREVLREALADAYEDLAVEPVEAGYEFSGSEILVTGSETGREIEEQKLFDSLEAGLFEGRREYEVPVGVSEPELTTAEAEALKPTQLLGKYRTDYTLTSDQSEERIENLEIASEAVNSTFLAPGETFSMNDTVSSLDYNKTKVIINGQEEKADGGGLCQVTSTLYMAANYAGLDVTERHPHATQLPYIRPGLDATVWFGDINGQPLDMKFENTTDAYVLLREYVVDGFVYAEVWGQPTGLTVQMDSRPTKMGEEQSKWTTYQKVTDEDGKVVYDGILHRDVYEPLVDEKGVTIPPPKVHVPPVNQ